MCCRRPLCLADRCGCCRRCHCTPLSSSHPRCLMIADILQVIVVVAEAAGGGVPVPLSSLAGLVRRVALAAVATSTSPSPASSRVVVAGTPPPLRSRPGPRRRRRRPRAGDPPPPSPRSAVADRPPPPRGAVIVGCVADGRIRGSPPAIARRRPPWQAVLTGLPPTVREAAAALPAAIGSIDGRPRRFATIEAADGGSGSSVDELDVLIMWHRGRAAGGGGGGRRRQQRQRPILVSSSSVIVVAEWFA